MCKLAQPHFGWRLELSVKRLSGLKIRVFALICFLMTANAQAKIESGFKELTNLQTLAVKSAHSQLPIMLMFGAEWCEYCQLLDERVFSPMALSDLYDERVVLMRHVGVDIDTPLPDWNGNLINKAKWAYELNADLTPTVIFLDDKGQEVANRIVGISDVNQYPGLIHERLNQAYKNMGLTKQIPVTPELLELQQNVQ